MNYEIPQLPRLPEGATKPVLVASKAASDAIAEYQGRCAVAFEGVRETSSKNPEDIGFMEADYLWTGPLNVLRDRIKTLESLREPVSTIAEWVRGLPETNEQETIDRLGRALVDLGWPIEKGNSGEWKATSGRGPMFSQGANGFIRSHPEVFAARAANKELVALKSEWKQYHLAIDSAIHETADVMEGRRRKFVGMFSNA